MPRGGQKKAEKKQAAAELTPAQQAVQFKDQGTKAFVDEKYDVAIELFSKAIELDGENEKLYSNRSATFLLTGEFEQALRDAERCIKIAPTWGKGYYRAGQAYERLMQLPLASETYKKGLEVDAAEQSLKEALQILSATFEEMKLSEKEIQEAAQSNPEADKFGEMIKWMKEGGAKFPHLYLQYYSADYRGVHALTRVPNKKIVLEVPLDLIMTSDIAKASDIGEKISKSGCRMGSDHSWLASYLLQEKYDPESRWQPYIKILPVHYRNMPIFFEEDELALLKGSFTLQKIAERKEELKEEYDNICSHVPEFRRFSHFDFIWARLVVITRIFGIEVKGHKTDGLVPMADMLNHKRPNETSWEFDNSRNAFTITSLKAMERGDQIYDSYGRKCNWRFFVNYGFCLEENEDNQVAMWFSVPAEDPLYKMKQRLMGGRISGQRFQIPVQYEEKVTKECFSFLRFAFARDKELMPLAGSTEDLRNKDIDPMSIENELKVLEVLHHEAKRVLSGFPNDIEEDNKILGDASLTMNQRNCVLMRRGEKQVLHHYINLYPKVKELAAMPWQEFKRLANKLGRDPVDRYIQLVWVKLKK